jgi:hypothetical protein
MSTTKKENEFDPVEKEKRLIGTFQSAVLEEKQPAKPN